MYLLERNIVMQKREQAGYKSRLVEFRKRLAREVDATEEALRQDVVTPGDITTVPTHPADNDVEGLDAEIAIAQNGELLFEQVEGALARIEAGTFGVCDDCGQPIGKERLHAIPYTPRCIDCAQGHHDAIEGPVLGEPRRMR
jgi:RNA polymerase-binding protein DksA